MEARFEFPVFSSYISIGGDLSLHQTRKRSNHLYSQYFAKKETYKRHALFEPKVESIIIIAGFGDPCNFH